MDNQDNQREAVLLSYMAGIFDGEGTIGIIKASPHSDKENFRYIATAGMGMTDRKTIELFNERFSPNRKIYIERVPNRKLIYRWRLAGNATVMKVIEALLPYLKIKKQEAEVVKEFLDSKSKYLYKDRIRIGKNSYVSEKELKRREELYQKVKKLKSLSTRND